ncbi:hypothetical protein CHS0354_003629 [Potamilus streckersoni]|uniref:RING finger protein 37 n=1 Tax=Potamilus streckersoni TaxID=2493646 RepID=A0AAE0S911_9BIVA|nr:hypothetical protein CHS0354_003629 [Potamilus streckersoni]
MLVDFCSGAFQPHITSDKVACDNHDVTNLISLDPLRKRQGFIAEYFIKPPVNITIQFPCNVEIYQIVLDPVVGRQKSLGFGIYTRSKQIIYSSLLAQADNSNQNKADPCKFGNLIKQSDAVCDSLFVPVGRVVLDMPQIVCFHNVMYRERKPWVPDNVPASHEYSNTGELRHHNLQSLASVSHVTIRITRTSSGSAVALKSIQIWGQPSISVPTDLQDKIYSICQQVFDTKARDDAISPSCSDKGVLSSEDRTLIDIKTKLTENGVEIPEDFLDCITFDIMSMPMLLPCGKNIDQSTLEKFISNEASWGRSPSDLFTGVPFQSGSQAVANTVLRIRIDKFLMDHSEQLKHVPRTVGKSLNVKSKTEYSSNSGETSKLTPEMCRLQSDKIIASIEKNKPTAKEVRKRPLPKDNHNSVTQPSEAKIIKSEKTIFNKKKFDGKVSDYDITHDEQNFNESEVTSEMVHHSTSSHRDELQQSLDAALNSTLGRLPSFTSFQKKNVPTTCREICCECQILLGSSSVKYKLPCDHIICRTCLNDRLQTSNSKCAVCQTLFKSKEIQRIFN